MGRRSLCVWNSEEGCCGSKRKVVTTMNKVSCKWESRIFVWSRVEAEGGMEGGGGGGERETSSPSTCHTTAPRGHRETRVSRWSRGLGRARRARTKVRCER